MMELKANLKNPEQQDPQKPISNDRSSDEIRAIVESVVAPMISTFQNDTDQDLIDKLTEKHVADSDETKVPVINVNIDSPVDQSQTTHEVLPPPPPPPPPAVCNYEPPPPPPPPPPRQPMRKDHHHIA